MTARRAASRLPLLAFVFALLLKGAVPLLATWSAHLQGKGVAEVCDMYGVALPGTAGTAPAGPHDTHDTHPTHDMHATHDVHATHDMHAMHGAHAMQAIHAAPDHAPADGPHRPDGGRHAGDHCVLGALVAFAGGASPSPALALALDRDAPSRPQWSADPVGADAAARWAALLGHGPPAFS